MIDEGLVDGRSLNCGLACENRPEKDAAGVFKKAPMRA